MFGNVEISIDACNSKVHTTLPFHTGMCLSRHHIPSIPSKNIPRSMTGFTISTRKGGTYNSAHSFSIGYSEMCRGRSVYSSGSSWKIGRVTGPDIVSVKKRPHWN